VARQIFPHPYDPQSSMAEIEQYDHLSSADRINQMDVTPLQRVLLERLMSMQCHNNPSQGGFVEFLRWYALSHFDMETYFSAPSRHQFAEGTQALINGLLSDCDAEIHLNCPVAAVQQDADRVTITTENGKIFLAENAILSVPVNVLSHIDFSPALNAAGSQVIGRI